MTLTTYRAAGCSGKLQYETWRAAEKVAKRMRRAHDEMTQTYKCRFCQKFHVGQSSVKRRDR